MFEFDDAIQSRASLILRFDKLSRDERNKVRTSRVDKLRATGRYDFLTAAEEEYRALDTESTGMQRCGSTSFLF